MSPDTNPLMLTVPLFSSPPLSGSATVSVESNATADPPPVNVTVPLVVIVGATCTAVSVDVAAPLVALPSLTTQSIVRLVWLPPPVGSPFDGLKLKVMLSSAA